MSSAPDRVKWSWPAEVSTVTAARHAVVAWLRETGTPGRPLNDVALVVSEAVTNVITHAYVGRDPGEVHVALSVEETEYLLVVEDDGNGLRPRHDSPGLGYGLALMVATAKRFEAQTIDGAGTRVSAWFGREWTDEPLPLC